MVSVAKTTLHLAALSDSLEVVVVAVSMDGSQGVDGQQHRRQGVQQVVVQVGLFQSSTEDQRVRNGPEKKKLYLAKTKYSQKVVKDQS
jgi:hypothetical protein